MFIIYSEFMHTKEELNVKERVALALKKSGVSITATSLTDFVAFMIGIWASFRSVRIFCIYAGNKKRF